MFSLSTVLHTHTQINLRQALYPQNTNVCLLKHLAGCHHAMFFTLCGDVDVLSWIQGWWRGLHTVSHTWPLNQANQSREEHPFRGSVFLLSFVFKPLIDKTNTLPPNEWRKFSCFSYFLDFTSPLPRPPAGPAPQLGNHRVRAIPLCRLHATIVSQESGRFAK